MEENIFDCVLDDDEKVQRVFKPNKTKMFWQNFILGAVVWGMIAVFALIAIIGITVDPEETVTTIGLIIGYSAIGLDVVLGILLSIWFFKLAYAKTYYCYTNKRFIVRHGIFGVDYKSLDMDMVGAINVNVSLLDKLVKKNTGTIAIGSPSSPINTSIFTFANISNPYEIYKELKQLHNSSKENKND